MGRLIGEEEPVEDEVAETYAGEEETIEKSISLAEQRVGAVMAPIRGSGARRVLDLGWGEGLWAEHRRVRVARMKILAQRDWTLERELR